MTTELHFKTVRELGELVRTRQISPVELAESSLHRLDIIGRHLNAVVTLMESGLPSIERTSSVCPTPWWTP